ncbi:MAG: spore coat protein [Clostridia bacterium]|jgi:spore coat protein CotF|nr:spore coat protein [Clostridia bacterium]
MEAHLGDKEMMQIILDKHKECAVKLTRLAMECTNFNLRNEVLRTLDMCLRHQHHLFELMHHMGWYQPTPASVEETSGLKSTIRQHVTV